VNDFRCDCVVREDDVAEALGSAVTFVPSGRSSMECTASVFPDGETEAMTVSLYVHDTLAATAAPMKPILHEGITILPEPCEVAVAKGHVVYIAEGMKSQPCDKPALQQVIDKVSARLSE
jgi:hypothetical protein